MKKDNHPHYLDPDFDGDLSNYQARERACTDLKTGKPRKFFGSVMLTTAFGLFFFVGHLAFFVFIGLWTLMGFSTQPCKTQDKK